LWKLTEKGVNLARSTRGGLSAVQIDQLAQAITGPSPDPGMTEAGAPTLPPGGAPQNPAVGSPSDRIDQALLELKESVSRDLLEIIGRAPPDFFETLVLDLLHAMGYGTSRADLQHVGGSGDGGIDGIISLDKLGLEKVYVQAKRWRGSVRSPEVQGFMGALQLQGARKGVLLTTGGFTSEAKRAAGMSSGSIVLVDGQRLGDLMIEYGVGITPRPVMSRRSTLTTSTLSRSRGAGCDRIEIPVTWVGATPHRDLAWRSPAARATIAAQTLRHVHVAEVHRRAPPRRSWR
jgi:restriction system protein